MLYYTQKSSFVNSQKRKISKIFPFSRRNKLQHRFQLQIVGFNFVDLFPCRCALDTDFIVKRSGVTDFCHRPSLSGI